MLDALRHRAPLSASVWLDGPAAIGQRLSRESASRFGVRHRGEEHLVAADARLDHLPALRSELQLPASAGIDAVLLAAYARWDAALVEHLSGEFAFVLWDGRRRRLLCARDRFGVKPLYYARTPMLLAAASEMKALLTLSELPRDLDEARVADFLEGVLDDPEATFYRHIRRLPPAHVLLADDNTLTLRCYWMLDAEVPDACRDARECVRLFRETFIDAVRRRLPADATVGTMLSGGLDSASITCVARDLAASGAARLPLHAISALFPGIHESDERSFVDAVVAQGGIEPHVVDATDLPPLASLERLLEHQDEPRLAANLYIVRALYETARAAGVEIAFDGIDGDTVVSHGIFRLVELAAARQWRDFVTESRGVATLRRRDPLVNLRRYAYPAITKRAREGRWLAALADVRALAHQAEVSPWGIVRDALLSPLLARPLSARLPRRAGPVRRYALVDHELARRTRMAERHAATRGTRAESERADHHWRLTRSIFGYGFEVMDHASAAFGIETRYPFFDQRLVTLSLAIPAQFKLRGGWTRWVLREAMAGILPPAVQWRTGKADIGVHFRRAMLASHRNEMRGLVYEGGSELAGFVDRAALRTRYEEYLRDGSDRGAMALWQALVLAAWLRRQGRPRE